MGCNKSKPEPGYLYVSTCRNAMGRPCTRNYTMYQSDGGELQKSTFVTPYRDYGGAERTETPDYVAAMILRHPKNPSKTTDFEAECLHEHNLCRARHGVPPLKLDRKLGKYATAWAEELASKNQLNHRDDSLYGENIYMACGKEINGRAPVRAWYNELRYYDFKKNTFSKETGHFSQVVWRNSQKLGVGVAAVGRTTYVVCNYDPPGNFNDLFAPNVPPPL